MHNTDFDLLIVGSGPAGQHAALHAARMGKRAGIIERKPKIGGAGLQTGTIPSKALLHSTELYHLAAHSSSLHGIKTEKISIDLKTLMKRKDGVVDSLRKGVETLVKKRDIEIVYGAGKLLGDSKVEIDTDGKKQTLQANHIVIATGSRPAELPFMKFDGELVVSSDQAIAFDSVPKKLVVVGGGAIGLELGSVWNRLGSDVTVVECLPKIAITYDDDISKLAARIFKKQGLKIETSTKVTGLKKSQGKHFVTVEKKGKASEIMVNKVLVSVGRVPFHQNLGLDAVEVALDERGFIKTESGFKTSASGIYAIGDATPGPMLAHKAEEEGVAVAELIAGHHGEVNYSVIPNVIYTEPELAAVGIGENEAKEKGLAIKVGKFPMAANGRAIASCCTEGMVKVIADAETDRLLGVQIIASNASELIAAAVTHMEYGGSAEDMGRTIHAHPTLSEALKEAALAVDNAAIHTL